MPAGIFTLTTTLTSQPGGDGGWIMAPHRNLYTISDAIAHQKQIRLENEARERTESHWRRQEAAQQSFLREQSQFVRSSISPLPQPSKTTDYYPTPESFPVSKPDGHGHSGRGNSGPITFGIILAIAICWYALAHGATLTAIAAVAILIAAAVVAIALALAVIAFVRAFAGPIIAIGLVGWYLWAHTTARLNIGRQRSDFRMLLSPFRVRDSHRMDHL